jgi:hypothetical protein
VGKGGEGSVVVGGGRERPWEQDQETRRTDEIQAGRTVADKEGRVREQLKGRAGRREREREREKTRKEHRKGAKFGLD